VRKIEIFDTTLRDGEQSAGVNLHAHEKLEIAYQLERYGVDVMEAGFPASSRGDYLAVEDIAKHIKDASVAGLARSTQADIDLAWGALQAGVAPRIHIFLATSPIHMEYKLRMSPDEVVATAVSSISYAASKFPCVEWSAEDATRSDLPFLAKIVTAVIDAGAHVINLPDTVGYATQSEYQRMFQYLANHVPNLHRVKLSAHCHDDLGMAVTNTLAAIEWGVHQIEGTINGIGERAGNASLEEVAVALAIRNDVYQVENRLDLTQTIRTSRLVSKLTGMVVPPNKAVVGANAFAHESGIHQDGVMKNHETYEIIRPEMVGLTSNTMVMGKHSGRHAFRQKCDELGLHLDDAEFHTLFQSFKELTERKKEVGDDDIMALATEASVYGEPLAFELEYLHVSYSAHTVSTTTVGVRTPTGEVVQEAAVGQGSVEAIYNTIERIVGSPVALIDYRIQSATPGTDALAEVYVKIQHRDCVTRGRGVDSDVLYASAKAVLDAINRIWRLHPAEVFSQVSS